MKKFPQKIFKNTETFAKEYLEEVSRVSKKLDLKKIIIDNKTIYDNIDKSWQEDQERWDKYYKDNIGFSSKDLFEEVDCEYIKFKRSAQKEVNYLCLNLNHIHFHYSIPRHLIMYVI